MCRALAGLGHPAETPSPKSRAAAPRHARRGRERGGREAGRERPLPPEVRASLALLLPPRARSRKEGGAGTPPPSAGDGRGGAGERAPGARGSGAGARAEKTDRRPPRAPLLPPAPQHPPRGLGPQPLGNPRLGQGRRRGAESRRRRRPRGSPRPGRARTGKAGGRKEGGPVVGRRGKKRKDPVSPGRVPGRESESERPAGGTGRRTPDRRPSLARASERASERASGSPQRQTLVSRADFQ